MPKQIVKVGRDGARSIIRYQARAVAGEWDHLRRSFTVQFKDNARKGGLLLPTGAILTQRATGRKEWVVVGETDSEVQPYVRGE
jgi:hypothetical protein